MSRPRSSWKRYVIKDRNHKQVFYGDYEECMEFLHYKTKSGFYRLITRTKENRGKFKFYVEEVEHDNN